MNEDYIKAKLESAGRTMMMLPATGTRPKGYVSGWPDIVREFADMIEAPKENSQTIMRATMAQMNELNEVEGWLVALAVNCREKRCPYVAKVVGLASLRWPLSERPVFTWAKLGRKMHVSPPTIKNWYDQGVDMIRAELATGVRGEVWEPRVASFPKNQNKPPHESYIGRKGHRKKKILQICKKHANLCSSWPKYRAGFFMPICHVAEKVNGSLHVAAFNSPHVFVHEPPRP